MLNVSKENEIVKSSKLEWALWFADLGFEILQLSEGSKNPKSGFGWLRSLSSDPDVIKQWFEDDPLMNYGVCPGDTNVILDLDYKPYDDKDGEQFLIGLELEHGDIEKTLTVVSPSGGKHLYFKTPIKLGNANSFPKEAGIDVRGAHGYVVGPGSELIEGKCKNTDTPGPYITENIDMGVVDIPDWLLNDYLKPKRDRDNEADEPLIPLDLPENIAKADDFLKTRAPAVQGRGGNQWTYDTATYLRDFGISEAKCIDLFFSSGWNDRCIPAWGWDDLSDVVEHAYRYGQNRPGSKADFMTLFESMLSPEALAGFLDIEDQIEKPRSRFSPKNELQQDHQPDPDWLIPGVIQRETLALFYGRENSFKSFMALDLVLSAAAGVPWAASADKPGPAGYCANKPLTTVYIAGEGARGIEKLRRPAWRKHHGTTAKLPFYTIDEMPSFSNDDEVSQLIQEIEAAGLKPDIIVVDTVARAMLGLDENSAKDSGVFVAACDRIKRHFKCAVIAVHHSGKDDGKGTRGSTNLPASFDSRFLIRGDVDSRIVTIKNEKQKDGEPWPEPITFKGETVQVPTGNHSSKPSLVFQRILPPASSKAHKQDDRVAEVKAALAMCGGHAGLVTTNVLATNIIDNRMDRDETLAAKANDGDINRMITNEARQLQRQAKESKEGKTGLLTQFIASDPDHHELLWTLPDID